MKIQVCLILIWLLALGWSPLPAGQGGSAGRLRTTAGDLEASGLQLILPHEHIFTDLRGPDKPGYGEAPADQVVERMRPFLLEARDRGVGLLVECTTIGVGRNVPILKRLSVETGLPVMVATGVYCRDEFAPAEYRKKSIDELETWMTSEILHGIEGTGVKAGFIKTAASRDGLSELDERVLRASARAAKATGVALASHTASGTTVTRQADILAEEGLNLDRFVWVHAQAEKDSSFHVRLAARGAFIEFDSVGRMDDSLLIGFMRNLMGSGHLEKILLSHDSGWYSPGQAQGGEVRPYTYLTDTLLPKLRAQGFTDAQIQALVRHNPIRAFALR